MNVGKFGELVFLAVLRGGESFGIRESAAEMRSGGKARSAGDFRNGKFAFEQIFFCVAQFCFLQIVCGGNTHTREKVLAEIIVVIV